MKLSALLITLVLFYGSDSHADESNTSLRDKVIDASKTIEYRIRAFKEMYRHLLIDGEIPQRTICVWDVFGRQGPVFESTVDIQLRFKFYGVSMNLLAYLDEDEMIVDFKSGKCDVAVMSGAKANQFNSFTGSIEALGGVTSKSQMKILLQVLSNPKAMAKMENDEYVIIGVIPLGENYLFSRNGGASDLRAMMHGKAGMVKTDLSQEIFFKSFDTEIIKQTNFSMTAHSFNTGSTDIILASRAAYNMHNLNKGLEFGSIIDYPISQSTLQIVGRIEAVPPEMALMLREDLYIKFNYMYNFIDKMSTVPKPLFKSLSLEDEELILKKINSVRDKYKKTERYDKSMLNLMARIRCKLDQHSSECK